MNVHFKRSQHCKNTTEFHCVVCEKPFEDKDSYVVTCPNCLRTMAKADILAMSYPDWDPEKPLREKKQAWLFESADIN